MKKIFGIVIALGIFAGGFNMAYAGVIYLYGLPEWTELELAAEEVDIEISRTRPIAHRDLIEILEAYIEILRERLAQIQVGNN